MGVNLPNVLVVNSTLPIKTFAEFTAYAKANPGKLDFASTGTASASPMAGRTADRHGQGGYRAYPVQGGAPAFQDLMGARVASYFSTLATAQPGIDAGKLMPLATTAANAWLHCPICQPIA